MNIGLTSFEPSAADIRLVRDAVFGEEQGVRRDLDWDGRDPACVHALAADPRHGPVGTGRLQPDGRIGRLAVLPPWRRRGIGGALLEALVASARDRGLEQVRLHAQVHTVAFYEQHGFERQGFPFVEAGIRHVGMTRSTRAPRGPGSPRPARNASAKRPARHRTGQ